MIYEQQTREVEQVTMDEPHVDVDLTRPLEEQVTTVLTALRKQIG